MSSSDPVDNTNSPLPSTLVTPSQLRHKSLGDKVRFLGCVHHYDSPNATLHLSYPHSTTATNSHNYPYTTSTSTSTTSTTKSHATTKDPTLIHVSLTTILDTLAREDLEVGSWLNIIGYVATSPTSHPSSTPVAPPTAPVATVSSSRLGALGSGHVSNSKTTATAGKGEMRGKAEGRVHVQAIAVWNAGAINLGEYESAVRERQAMGL